MEVTQPQWGSSCGFTVVVVISGPRRVSLREPSLCPWFRGLLSVSQSVASLRLWDPTDTEEPVCVEREMVSLLVPLFGFRL